MIKSLWEQEMDRYGFSEQSKVTMNVPLSQDTYVEWNAYSHSVCFYRFDGGLLHLYRQEGPAALFADGSCSYRNGEPLWPSHGPELENEYGCVFWNCLHTHIDLLTIPERWEWCGIVASMIIRNRGDVGSSLPDEGLFTMSEYRCMKADLYFGRISHPLVDLPVWNGVHYSDVAGVLKTIDCTYYEKDYI